MYMIAEVSQYVAVASFAEAWIEIFSSRLTFLNDFCRLLRGGVDWNLPDCKHSECNEKVASFAEAWIEINIDTSLRPPYSRLLRGGVDWNIITGNRSTVNHCRLLRGGVDWNSSYFVCCFKIIVVASFAEAWIEIGSKPIFIDVKLSPPSRRRGLKSLESPGYMRPFEVASFAEAWIEILIYAAAIWFDSGRLLRGGVDWN